MIQSNSESRHRPVAGPRLRSSAYRDTSADLVQLTFDVRATVTVGGRGDTRQPPARPLGVLRQDEINLINSLTLPKVRRRPS
jgi:hypothetical protein